MAVALMPLALLLLAGQNSAGSLSSDWARRSPDRRRSWAPPPLHFRPGVASSGLGSLPQRLALCYPLLRPQG
jgi:hypothetical protein